MSDIEIAVKGCKKLESILAEYCNAEGKGLHEKLTSVDSRLPKHIVAKARKVATIRNKAVHEENFSISNIASFRADVESVEKYIVQQFTTEENKISSNKQGKKGGSKQPQKSNTAQNQKSASKKLKSSVPDNIAIGYNRVEQGKGAVGVHLLLSYFIYGFLSEDLSYGLEKWAFYVTIITWIAGLLLGFIDAKKYSTSILAGVGRLPYFIIAITYIVSTFCLWEVTFGSVTGVDLNYYWLIYSAVFFLSGTVGFRVSILNSIFPDDYSPKKKGNNDFQTGIVIGKFLR